MKIMLDPGALMPTRGHTADAGLDLMTPVTRAVYPHSSTNIDTGVHIEIPEGYCGFLKSKSGLNTKHMIQTEGVIDAGYTGSIVVPVYNHSDELYIFNAGDKVTQLVILPIDLPELELVDSLEETDRGEDGFGSTGR